MKPLSWLLAAALIAISLTLLPPSLPSIDPELLNAENRRRCAHAIIFTALLLEAAAIWIHASAQGRSTLLKLVAGMFAFSGLLGLSSIAMEIAPTVTANT